MGSGVRFPHRLSHIPGLEAHDLDGVFGAAERNNHAWREPYRQWKDDVIRLRGEIHELAEMDPTFRAEEMRICAEDPVYWLAMYGWIEEPRTMPGEPTVKPFIPFEFQVRLLQEFVRTVETADPRDLYISKARGLGASWLFCAAAVWGWLFRPWRGKLVSRNEKLVDSPMDLDSLFGKIDFIVDYLPPWMLPQGFSRKAHRRELLLRNPATGATIAGESTTSMAMRGARSTYSIYDEAAFIRDFAEVWATGEATTTHRIGLSTESFTVGFDWWRAWHAIKEDSSLADTVIELEWWENAYQDQEWYDKAFERAGDQKEKFRREYERNPYEGSAQFIYEIARDMPLVHIQFDPTKPLLISIDPGHADDTAIVWGQERMDDGHVGVDFLGSYERNYAPVEWYAHLLTGIRPEPGDKCWELSMSMTIEEEELFAFFANLPWSQDRVQVFMDPAGAQKHAGYSFFEVFADTTYQLRARKASRYEGLELEKAPRPTPIIPMYQAIKGVKTHHEERRNATRPYLPYCRVNDTLSGRRIKECLMNYRMSELTDKSTSEAKPIHDRYSHIVTACEYLFSHMSLGMVGVGETEWFATPNYVGFDGVMHEGGYGERGY